MNTCTLQHLASVQISIPSPVNVVCSEALAFIALVCKFCPLYSHSETLYDCSIPFVSFGGTGDHLTVTLLLFSTLTFTKDTASGAIQRKKTCTSTLIITILNAVSCLPVGSLRTTSITPELIPASVLTNNLSKTSW